MFKVVLCALVLRVEVCRTSSNEEKTNYNHQYMKNNVA
jgi:hypothetical protein